jgi:hypothetical protein
MTVMLDNGVSLRDYMTEKLGDRYEPASLAAFCEGLEEFVEDCIAKEREACAKIADERERWAKEMFNSNYRAAMAKHIADQIRARGPSPQEELPL